MLPIPCLLCFLDPVIEDCELANKAEKIRLNTTYTDDQRLAEYAALIAEALERQCSRIEDIKAYHRGKEG